MNVEPVLDDPCGDLSVVKPVTLGPAGPLVSGPQKKKIRCLISNYTERAQEARPGLGLLAMWRIYSAPVGTARDSNDLVTGRGPADAAACNLQTPERKTFSQR